MRAFGQSFGDVMFSTIGMTVAEAALLPTAFALLPALFRGKQLSVANLVFYTSGALGYSLSMALAGGLFKLMETHRGSLPTVLEGMEAWCSTSFVVGAIGPLFAGLVLLIKASSVQTPKGDTRAHGGGVARYFKRNWRTNVAIYGATAAATLSLSPLLGWLATGLIRHHGLSPAEVGSQVGAVLGAGTITGIALSGVLIRVSKLRSGSALVLIAAES